MTFDPFCAWVLNIEGNRKICASYPTVFKCVVQAIVRVESTDVYDRLFRLLTACLALVWRTTEEHVQHMVTQVHKDLHDGIEAARVLRFPRSRPCDDQTHVMARLSMQLPAKFAATQSSSQTVPVNTLVDETPAAHFSMTGERLKENLRELLLHCHSIDLLDTCLHHFLIQNEGCANARSAMLYLRRERYVQVVSREQLLQWNIRPRSEQKTTFLFAGAWQGLFGQAPGTHCGSQPVEAFHARWEGYLDHLGGTLSNSAVLDKMRDLYREPQYIDVHPGAGALSLQTPKEAVSDFLSGTAITKTGLCCAVDYMRAHEARPARRMCIERCRHANPSDMMHPFLPHSTRNYKRVAQEKVCML